MPHRLLLGPRKMGSSNKEKILNVKYKCQIKMSKYFSLNEASQIDLCLYDIILVIPVRPELLMRVKKSLQYQ